MSNPPIHPLSYASPHTAPYVEGTTFRLPPRSIPAQRTMTSVRIVQVTALALAILIDVAFGVMSAYYAIAIIVALPLSIMMVALLAFPRQVRSATTIGVTDEGFRVAHDSGEHEDVKWSDVIHFTVSSKLFGITGCGDLQVLTYSVGTNLSLIKFHDLPLLNAAHDFLTAHWQRSKRNAE